MILQRTLKQAISATGVGLHSGEEVILTLLPAPPDTGIIFRRTDLNRPVELKVNPSLANDTRLSSTLVNDAGVRIGTIEHLMSALSGVGIDNLVIEVTAAEIPIMDGSAAPFIDLLQTAGVAEQTVKKRFIRVLKTVEVKEHGVWVKLEPYNGFKVTLSIDFNHPVFHTSPQIVSIDFAHHSYTEEISRARTFGFMHDVEYMRNNGLARGGSLENAIIIKDECVLNPEGLRFPDEFVRHKVLDAIGDLYIIGHPLIAAFSGHKSGHAMNNKLLRKLLATPTAWEYTSQEAALNAPSSVYTSQVAK